MSMARRRADLSLDRRTLLKTTGAAGPAPERSAGCRCRAAWSRSWPAWSTGAGISPSATSSTTSTSATSSYVDCTEVFLDDGQADLFGVMRELVKAKYPGGGGFAGEIYNVGYTRAMLQAALTL
jgi:hypothetical protein